MKKEKYFSIEAGSEQNNYELLSVSLAAHLSHHAKCIYLTMQMAA